MKINLERIREIQQEEDTITATAKRYAKEVGIDYDDNFRRKVSHKLKSDVEEEDFESTTVTVTNQYEGKKKVLSAIHPETGKFMDIWNFCDFYGIPKEHVKSYKAVNSQNGGIPTYNIASHSLHGEYFEEFYKTLLAEIEKIGNRPVTTLKRDAVKDGHLLVIDPADVHIGKLADSFETGEDYDSQIAVQRVREGVEGILSKSRGFNIDKILFVGGNDILHIDTPRRTTTSGTPQDTDKMWYRNFLMAKEIYIEILNSLMEIADVHFVFNPSNHDYTHGFFLADSIKTYFKDCGNITFDCSLAHRKYFTYGSNLIGTTHGDGGKINDLPLTMAHESKDWSTCKHRYIYTHHVHHKVAKDYQGVAMESLRSPSHADSWHHRNQYTNNIKAIEGFIHHPEFGQVSRITHIF